MEEAQAQPSGQKRLPPIIRALGSRNYMIYFCAQVVSQTGLWMQRVAMGWLVYRLTDSTRALGIIDFLAAIPTVLLLPLTGYLLPRWDLRKVLVVTQAMLMAFAALIGALTLSGGITYPILACIALCMGMTNAFDMPVRQSFVVYLVDNKDDMTNALALNSSLFNVARLIGPSVAGMTIHRVGEGICFLLNSVAYSSTIFAVKTMKITQSTVANKGKGGGFRSILSGFALLKEFPPFANILGIVIATGIFGAPYITLMPSMARTVLGGTSKTMGTLLMCVGIGALTGSLVMAARKSPVGLDRWAGRLCCLFGAAVSLFALSRMVWLSMLLLVPVGFLMVTGLISCNTFLQTLVDNENRSALMSLYVASMTGIAPIGSILVGWLGEVVGTSPALCISGAVCALSTYYFSRRLKKLAPLIRRTFVKRGFHLKEGNRWEWA